MVNMNGVWQYPYAPVPENTHWMTDAACDGAASRDRDPFFPRVGNRSGDHYAEARAICVSCPVAWECRAWNDQQEADIRNVKALDGFYSGESPSDRLERRKREDARKSPRQKLEDKIRNCVKCGIRMLPYKSHKKAREIAPDLQVAIFGAHGKCGTCYQRASYARKKGTTK